MKVESRFCKSSSTTRQKARRACSRISPITKWVPVTPPVSVNWTYSSTDVADNVAEPHARRHTLAAHYPAFPTTRHDAPSTSTAHCRSAYRIESRRLHDHADPRAERPACTAYPITISMISP